VTNEFSLRLLPTTELTLLSGVPDAEARFAILKVLLSKTPHSITEEELHFVAARAHGYVGADLNAVVHEAGTLAIKRWLADHSARSDVPTSPAGLVLEISDLAASLPTVRPSAMRSLFFESLPVRYTDIGGQARVIRELRQAVEWPLLHDDVFKRLGVRPSKGILLYGPPGCSKTILVRACACESGVNFIAIKGPEVCAYVL
jgi:AAA family ATPase